MGLKKEKKKKDMFTHTPVVMGKGIMKAVSSFSAGIFWEDSQKALERE